MKNKITSEAIENLRLASGSQSYYKLSQVIGKPGTALQRYKDGTTSISLEKLHAIAETANLKMKIIFEKKQ